MLEPSSYIVTLESRVSQPQHFTVGWTLPVAGADLQEVEQQSWHPPTRCQEHLFTLKQANMSPNIAKGPLGGKSLSGEPRESYFFSLCAGPSSVIQDHKTGVFYFFISERVHF